MSTGIRKDGLVCRDKIDAVAEACAPIAREADARRRAHPAREDAATPYFTGRPQAIRLRHGS